MITEYRDQIAVAGSRSVTNIAADLSYSVSSNWYGRLMSVTEYSAEGTQLKRTSFGYDPHGRRNSETDARNGTNTYTFINDAVQTVTTPQPDGIQSAQTTTLGYNNLGEVTTITMPDGGVVNQSYHLNGALKRKWGDRTYPVGYGYDVQGRMRFMTNWGDFANSLGARVTEWQYDTQSGLLNKKLYPDTTALLYTNTPGGRLHSRTSGRAVTAVYSYTPAGELFSVNYSDSTVGITNDYNRLGHLVAVTNGLSIARRVVNTAGQVLTETYSGGVLNGLGVTNVYDQLLRRTNFSSVSPAIAYGYGSASRLDSVSAGGHSVSYSYLPNSPLVFTLQFAGGVSIAVTNQYDYLNRLTQISTSKGGSTVASFSYLYTNTNQRIRTTLADGSYWAHEYDELGQVEASRKHWSNGGLVAGQQFVYGYDDIGNRTSTEAGGDASGANLRSATYTPNDLNQYEERSVPGGFDVIGMSDRRATVTVNNQSAYRTNEYYRAELSINNASAPVYVSVTNKAVQGSLSNSVIGNVYLPKTPEIFAYDDDGNLLSDGRWDFGWDSENRLTNIVSFSSAPIASKRQLEFAYDHHGRRIQKVVSLHNGSNYATQYTRKFLYDGWNLVAELDETNGLVRSYVWGTDLSGSMQGAGGVGGLLSTTVHTGTNAGTYFYSYDGNGNVAALVNASSGVIAAEYEYGPFGELIRATGSMAFENPFRFSTKYTDDETDFVYYGYRFYNPSTGRWLSRDPIEEDGGKNLYGFVGNDGVNGFDFLGLKNCECATQKRTISVAAPNSPSANRKNRIANDGQGNVRSLLTAIDSSLKKTECISELTISAHGNDQIIDLGGDPDRQPTLDGSNDADWITPQTAFKIGQRLSRFTCFCKPCKIYILSCNVGLGTIPQSIANATGCKVLAPKGYCVGNQKNPRYSEIRPSSKDYPNNPSYPTYPGADSTFGVFKPKKNK